MEEAAVCEQEDSHVPYLSELRLYEGDEDAPDMCDPGYINLGMMYTRRVMGWLHRTFASGELNGKRVIDICCGSSIYSSLSSSKYFDSIFLTEYARPNRLVVQHWIDGTLHAFDWSPYYKLVAELEGDGISAEEIEERARQKVKGVFPCNLLEEPMFGEMSMPKADCIISLLTLEASSQDHDTYKSNMKKITSLLKQGGSLLLSSVLHCEGYAIDGEKFVDVNLDESFVRGALDEAGCEVDSFEEYSVPETDFSLSGKTYVFITAHKV